MGLRGRICVKTKDSTLLLGCYEARKEASHWTIYGSGERTGIETNHKMVQRAIRREVFYRSVIHNWRVVHIALALLTLSLTIWHIVYALQLLLSGK